MKFPRYFQHTNQPDSDALYVRHDDEHSDATVVTITGSERPPNMTPWPLCNTEFALALGLAKELTREEAENLEPK